MREVANLEYIQSQPVAGLILELLTKITKHDAALGIAEADMTVDTIAAAFRKQAAVNEAQRQRDIQESTDIVKKDLLDCELQSYSMNQEFAVPSLFGDHPTLTTAQRKKDVILNFPPRHKFTGTGGKEGNPAMTLEEFLGAMNRAQEDMQLSRKEFHDQLVNCSTGKAHSLLVDWIDNGENTDSIYHLLAVNFDKRVTPEQAKQQLRDFKVTRDMTMAKLEGTLTQLSSRAVATLPPGESRKTLQNIEAIQALTRSLPAASQNLATTQFSVLSSKLKRAATFQELMKGLNVYRSTIDADIKANGMDLKKKEGKPAGKGKGGNNNANKPRAQFGAFAVDASIDASSFQEGKQKGNGETKKKGGGKKNDGNGKGKNDGNPKPYCSLCGQTNHTAVQGCRIMKDNDGNPVRVDPVQQTCPDCPAHVSPRLNHPAKLCPWRPSGPWHKRR